MNVEILLSPSGVLYVTLTVRVTKRIAGILLMWLLLILIPTAIINEDNSIKTADVIDFLTD